MYDNNNLECMINCLEEYGYAYTKYEHSNGYCTINSDLLLKQLKLNEQEIRNKVIDEFVSRLEKHTQENWIDYQEYGITMSDIEKIAEEMRGAE